MSTILVISQLKVTITMVRKNFLSSFWELCLEVPLCLGVTFFSFTIFKLITINRLYCCVKQ